MPAPLSRPVQRFLEMMAAERNAATHTLTAYGCDLGEFAQFLARQGVKIGRAHV